MVSVIIVWWYRRSVAAEIPGPEGIPLAFLAPVEGAKVKDCMGAVFSPAHPRQLQAFAISHKDLGKPTHDVTAQGQRTTSNDPDLTVVIDA
jgi:hypothetical protein